MALGQSATRKLTHYRGGKAGVVPPRRGFRRVHGRIGPFAQLGGALRAALTAAPAAGQRMCAVYARILTVIDTRLTAGLTPRFDHGKRAPKPMSHDLYGPRTAFVRSSFVPEPEAPSDMCQLTIVL